MEPMALNKSCWLSLQEYNIFSVLHASLWQMGTRGSLYKTVGNSTFTILHFLFFLFIIITFFCLHPRTLFQTTGQSLLYRSIWQQYTEDFSNMTYFASTGKQNTVWGRSASIPLERIGQLNLQEVCLTPLLKFCSSWKYKNMTILMMGWDIVWQRTIFSLNRKYQFQNRKLCYSTQLLKGDIYGFRFIYANIIWN